MKKNSIAQARGSLRPFHVAVMLTIAVLMVLTLSWEIFRRQNPAETLFSASVPSDARLNFNVVNPAGRVQQIFRFTGRGHVLLYVWDDSCGLCVGELAELDAMADALPLDGRLRVISVVTSKEAVDRVLRLFNKNNIRHVEPYFAEDGDYLQQSLSYSELPNRYFIDPDGRFAGMARDRVVWNDPRIIDLIKNLTTKSE